MPSEREMAMAYIATVERERDVLVERAKELTRHLKECRASLEESDTKKAAGKPADEDF